MNQSIHQFLREMSVVVVVGLANVEFEAVDSRNDSGSELLHIRIGRSHRVANSMDFGCDISAENSIGDLVLVLILYDNGQRINSLVEVGFMTVDDTLIIGHDVLFSVNDVNVE